VNPQPPSRGSDPIEGSTLDHPPRGLTPLRVRRARIEDAGPIARVGVLGWQTTYRGLVPDAFLDALRFEVRQEVWRERLEGGDCTFVAEDHEIAGYCRARVPDEVVALYVLPQRQGAGLGSALLTAALDELRAHGGTEARLWVFEANHAARAFYARFGFVPDGTTAVDEGTGVDEIQLRAAL
jgi:ribosomal protein S18 acetylase RimI-like enzyme